jgi:hypothetical protein
VVAFKNLIPLPFAQSRCAVAGASTVFVGHLAGASVRRDIS